MRPQRKGVPLGGQARPQGGGSHAWPESRPPTLLAPTRWLPRLPLPVTLHLQGSNTLLPPTHPEISPHPRTHLSISESTGTHRIHRGRGLGAQPQRPVQAAG